MRDDAEALVEEAGGTSAFLLGYLAGLRPDEPAVVPPPLPLALATGAAGALLSAFLRRAGSWQRQVAWGVALGLPLLWIGQQVDEAAQRRRAIRLGLHRRTDAPPPRIRPGTIPLALVVGLMRRRDARRRGIGAFSWATLAGFEWTLALQRELLWRRHLRAWRARRAT